VVDLEVRKRNLGWRVMSGSAAAPVNYTIHSSCPVTALTAHCVWYGISARSICQADPLAGYKAVVSHRFSINCLHPFLLAGGRRCLKLARAEVSEVSRVRFAAYTGLAYSKRRVHMKVFTRT
jgi:hypothetical protein